MGLALIEVPHPALCIVGGRAAVSRYPLLTRDTHRYTPYFADVQLIAPEPTN